MYILCVAKNGFSYEHVCDNKLLYLEVRTKLLLPFSNSLIESD